MVFLYGGVLDLQRIIKKFHISFFYFITFIFSFLLLIIQFAVPVVWNYSVTFTQLAPALAVLFLAIIIKDKTAFAEIRSHINLRFIQAKWAILAIVVPAVCILTTSVIMSLLEIPFNSWKGNIQFHSLNILAILAGCFAEEIGWRGFLLPKLQKRYSPFVSSISVGVLWGVWHLNFTGGLLGFVLFTITITEMSILMTWLYNNTKGNLILMTTWHFIFSLYSHIFLWERLNLNLFIIESIVFGIVCMVILVTNKTMFFKIPVSRMLEGTSNTDKGLHHV